MAAKIVGEIKLQVPAGQASPANVGSMLGPHGVSSPQFCQQFNERTKNIEAGLPIPTTVLILEGRKFSFTTKQPPAAVLIRKALGLEKGSPESNKQKVGQLTDQQLTEVAKQKMPDLNANDIEAAKRIIAGTARSMGGDSCIMSKELHRSKRYLALSEGADLSRDYGLHDALQLVKERANAKFDESVDLAIHLNIKKSESVRGILSLPHSFGKKRRVLVFAKGEQVRQAEGAGADFVGSVDLIDKIKSGWLDFDVAVATPEMMRDVAVLGPILGRRGLMPNPKAGTVTMDVTTAVKELASGRREFRADKGGTVHATIGKVSMESQQLLENSMALLDSLHSQKPDGHKGRFMNNAYASSTMGIGIAIGLTEDGVDTD